MGIIVGEDTGGCLQLICQICKVGHSTAGGIGFNQHTVLVVLVVGSTVGNGVEFQVADLQIGHSEGGVVPSTKENSIIVLTVDILHCTLGVINGIILFGVAQGFFGGSNLLHCLASGSQENQNGRPGLFPLVGIVKGCLIQVSQCNLEHGICTGFLGIENQGLAGFVEVNLILGAGNQVGIHVVYLVALEVQVVLTLFGIGNLSATKEELTFHNLSCCSLTVQNQVTELYELCISFALYIVFAICIVVCQGVVNPNTVNVQICRLCGRNTVVPAFCSIPVVADNGNQLYSISAIGQVCLMNQRCFVNRSLFIACIHNLIGKP